MPVQGVNTPDSRPPASFRGRAGGETYTQEALRLMGQSKAGQLFRGNFGAAMNPMTGFRTNLDGLRLMGRMGGDALGAVINGVSNLFDGFGGFGSWGQGAPLPPWMDYAPLGFQAPIEWIPPELIYPGGPAQARNEWSDWDETGITRGPNNTGKGGRAVGGIGSYSGAAQAMGGPIHGGTMGNASGPGLNSMLGAWLSPNFSMRPIPWRQSGGFNFDRTYTQN